MILWFYWLSHWVSRVFLVLWTRRRRVGHEQMPRDGRVLLVANHASFLDPPLVGTAIGRTVHYLARESLTRIPVLGRMIRWLGTMFVDLEGSPRRGLMLAIEQLEQDHVVCLFPEGTRSHDGSIGEFARGMELVLRRTRTPVVPVGIRGSFECMGRGKRWPRPVRTEVHYGAPMTAEEILAPGGMRELRNRVCHLAGRPQDAETGDDADASTDRGAPSAAAGREAPRTAPAEQGAR